jgi:hypothetical protein
MAPADKALRSGELRNKMTALSALTTIYRVIDKFVLTFVPRESHRRPLPKKSAWRQRAPYLPVLKEPGGISSNRFHPDKGLTKPRARVAHCECVLFS